MWFLIVVGLGKFVLDPTALFEAKEKQESCIKERAALYEERKRVRVQKPKTFRTYVNGLGRVYSCAPDTQPITPSNKSIFPEYNKFMAACIGRARVNDAIEEADTPSGEASRAWEGLRARIPGQCHGYLPISSGPNATDIRIVPTATDIRGFTIPLGKH